MFAVPGHSCAYCDKPFVCWPKVVEVKVQPLVAPSTPLLKRKTFKERRSLALRKAESEDIRVKFPKKVPVIVERCEKEKALPQLDRVKYLVPTDMTLSQFVAIVRGRLRLQAPQSLCLLLGGGRGTLATLSQLMGDLYRQHRDEDGFLYSVYAAHEMYG